MATLTSIPSTGVTSAESHTSNSNTSAVNPQQNSTATTTPTTTIIHSCNKCGKSPATSRCSRCCLTYYCSGACQATDWKKHKLTCVPLQKQTFSTVNNTTNSITTNVKAANGNDSDNATNSTSNEASQESAVAAAKSSTNNIATTGTISANGSNATTKQLVSTVAPPTNTSNSSKDSSTSGNNGVGGKTVQVAVSVQSSNGTTTTQFTSIPNLSVNFPLSMQNVPNFLSAAVSAAVNSANNPDISVNGNSADHPPSNMATATITNANGSTTTVSANSIAQLNKKFEAMEKDLHKLSKTAEGSVRKQAKSTFNQLNASAQTPHYNSMFNPSHISTGSYLTVPYPLPAPLHSNNINPVYIPPCRPILRTSHLYFPLGNIPPLSSINSISAALLFPSMSGRDYLNLPLSNFPPVRLLYCDVGDIRHVLQSFVDLALKIRMKKLGQKSNKLELGGGVEFYLNDHEPRIIARAVLLLTAAAQCGKAIEQLEQQTKTDGNKPADINSSSSTTTNDRFAHWSISDHACFLFQLYGSFQLTIQQQRRLRYILHTLILLGSRGSPEQFSNHPWTNWFQLFDSGLVSSLCLIWKQWLQQCQTVKLKSVEPMWRAPDGVDKEAAKHLNYYYRTGTVLLSTQFIKSAPIKREAETELLSQGVQIESESDEDFTKNTTGNSSQILPPYQEEYNNSDNFLSNPTLLPIDFHETKQKFLFSRDPYSPLLPKLSGNVFQQSIDIWIKFASAIHTILTYNKSVSTAAIEQNVTIPNWFRVIISSRDQLYHLHVSPVNYDRILVYHQPEYTGLQPLILLARTRMNGAQAIIETSINFPSCFTLTTSGSGTATYSPDLHKFCLLALNANVKLVKNMMGLDMELYNYTTARVCVCRFILSSFSCDLTAPKGHISDGFRVLNDWFMTASTPILMHDEFAKIDPQQLEMLRMSTPRSVANMRTFMLFVSTVINNNIVENSAFRQRLTALFSTLLAPKNPFLCDYTFASFMTHLGLLKQQLTPLFSFVLCPGIDTTEKQMQQHATFYTSLSKLELCRVKFNLPTSMAEMSLLLSKGLNFDNHEKQGSGASSNNTSSGGTVKESVLSLLIVTNEENNINNKEDKKWVTLRDMDMLHWLRSRGRSVQLLDAFSYDSYNSSATFWIHQPFMNYARSCNNSVIALMDFDRLHIIGEPVSLSQLQVIETKDNGMKPI